MKLQNANDIPAMLGKACIAFNTKDYKHALYFYKKVSPIGIPQVNNEFPNQ